MELSFRKIIKIITAHLLVIIIFSLLLAGGGFICTKYLVQPTYSSTMKSILISETGIQNYTDITTLRRMVNTYVEFMDSRDFYEMIKKKTSCEYSAEQLQTMTKYTTFEDSEAFVITVTAPSSQTCAMLINAINDHAMEYISQKYNKIEIYTVESPSKPVLSKNQTVRNTLLGFIIGFILSSLIAVIISIFDVRIKSEDDIKEHFNIPILGIVPDFNLKRKHTK